VTMASLWESGQDYVDFPGGETARNDNWKTENPGHAATFFNQKLDTVTGSQPYCLSKKRPRDRNT